ncbi:TetR family transcriptional regulator [Amycolatopsis rhizosphaerae]|uniref:TetR family transcriptional regulator n=1 Tax=Amycolatopsis rhizosphaerae TaxID=2053003 RepID=A0A558D0W1_9PSEU|nr:TetR/AcrR family transcriptional regulator C-terminal domain-containing protein [Amycolatopsis rhizosphaerae]TVT54651.1 TetR family transcriptional regulator [Amycolatopsis rhizosphaerae]
MTADEQPIPSVWAREPRRRREQPVLGRSQIVAEAVRLLDEEGIDALSMRKLGTRLGAAATSLYRHVANKDELLELVVDEVVGELRVPPPGPNWRAAVHECARDIRAVLLRHPWIVTLLGGAGTAYLGPNMMLFSEDMLALFEGAGLGLPEANRAMTIAFAYVIGMTSTEAAWLTMLTRTGRDEAEWMRRMWPVARRAAEPYPRLRTLYAEQGGEQGDQDPRRHRDEEFEYGLDRVLDGLAPLVP